MGHMFSRIYAAFRTVGIPEEAAQSAAEALSADHLATKEDINRAEKELGGKIEQVDKNLTQEIAELAKRLAVHDWMLKTMFGMLASLFGAAVTILIKIFWPS